jgi:VWFA-related protein
MRRSFVPVAAVAVLNVALSAQQTGRVTFRAAVDVVAVEVQVIDREGRPIPTLAREDFTVEIDGRPRRVVTAEFVRHEDAASTARVFVLIVDQASLGAGDALAAAHAGRRFVDALQPSDYVGLFRYPVTASQLSLSHGRAAIKASLDRIVGDQRTVPGEFDLLPSEIVDLTARDRAVWEHVVRRDCHSLDPSCPARVMQAARAAASYAEADAGARVDAFRALMTSLAEVAGRKTLIVVSGGLLAADRATGRPDIGSAMMELGRDAARANAMVYVVHLDSTFFRPLAGAPRRVASQAPMLATPTSRDGRLLGIGLEQLAEAAGGAYAYVPAGTPDHVFARILHETSAFYLLGVEPHDAERDGRLHYLRVNVDVDDAVIRNRRHVVIPRRSDPLTARPRLE